MEVRLEIAFDGAIGKALQHPFDPDRFNTFAQALFGLGALTAVLALALYKRPMTDQQYGFRVAFPLMAGVLLGLVLLRVTYLR